MQVQVQGSVDECRSFDTVQRQLLGSFVLSGFVLSPLRKNKYLHDLFHTIGVQVHDLSVAGKSLLTWQAHTARTLALRRHPRQDSAVTEAPISSGIPANIVTACKHCKPPFQTR